MYLGYARDENQEINFEKALPNSRGTKQNYNA